MTNDKEVSEVTRQMTRNASMRAVPASRHRVFMARLPDPQVQRGRIHSALELILGKQLTTCEHPMKGELRLAAQPPIEVLSDWSSDRGDTQLVERSEEPALIIPPRALLGLDIARSELEWLRELYQVVSRSSEFTAGFVTDLKEFSTERRVLTLWDTWYRPGKDLGNQTEFLGLAITPNWRAAPPFLGDVMSPLVHDIGDELHRLKMVPLGPLELVQLMIGCEHICKHLASYGTPHVHFPGLKAGGATASLVVNRRKHILWRHPYGLAFSCHATFAARRT